MESTVQFIEKFNKLTSGVSGRDKFLKIVQQSCQVWEYHEKQRSDVNKKLVDKLTKIQSNTSMARKFFRLLRFVDGYIYWYRFFQKKSIFQLSLLDILDLCKNIFLSHFFLLDNLNLCAKLTLFSSEKNTTNWFKKIFHNDHAAQYTKWGIRSLVICLTCGIILEFNKFYTNYAKFYNDADNQYAKVPTEVSAARKQQAMLDEYKLTQYKIMRKQCINFCDLLGCLNSLGYLKFINQGMNGMLGVISGWLGECELWP